MNTTFGEQRTEEQKLYDAAVMERVKAGMTLLEEKHGPDWVDHINLDELDLRSGHACVLGQLYHGGFIDGLETLWPRAYMVPSLRHLAQTKGVDHGFFAAGAYSSEDNDEAWDALEAAWQDALTPVVTKA